jgi:hypothetical protein
MLDKLYQQGGRNVYIYILFTQKNVSICSITCDGPGLTGMSELGYSLIPLKGLKSLFNGTNVNFLVLRMRLYKTVLNSHSHIFLPPLLFCVILPSLL